MAIRKSDLLYVKLKQDSDFTVSREHVEFLANYFQQDVAFVIHFALARLAEDVESGRYGNPSEVLVGSRAPTAGEWSKLAARAVTGAKSRRFVPTQTIEKAWGIAAK